MGQSDLRGVQETCTIIDRIPLLQMLLAAPRPQEQGKETKRTHLTSRGAQAWASHEPWFMTRTAQGQVFSAHMRPQALLVTGMNALRPRLPHAQSTPLQTCDHYYGSRVVP
jgi:hypothetical protein